MLRPQMPTPLANSQVIDARNSASSARLRISAINHGIRAGIRSGTRATSLVISRRDSSSGSGPYLLAIALLLGDAGEIGRALPRPLFRKQRIVALARTLLRDVAVLVREVPKADRLGRARLLARGHHLTLANRAVLDVRLHGRGFDALDAVGAFLH